MKLIRSLIALSLLLVPASVLQAQLQDKKVLTLEVAERVATAAEAEAKKRNATVVIVVVDDGGYPILIKRLNDTQVASVDSASARRGPRRSSGDRVQFLKSKSAPDALRPSRCRAQPPF